MYTLYIYYLSHFQEHVDMFDYAIKPFLSVIIVLISIRFSNDTSEDIGDDICIIKVSHLSPLQIEIHHLILKK